MLGEKAWFQNKKQCSVKTIRLMKNGSLLKSLKNYILSEKTTAVNLIFISCSFQFMTSGHVYEEVKGVFFNRISTVVRMRVLDGHEQ